jgi:aspartate/glutamate racemase
MPFKLLTTADLHLGKKSSNVPRSLEESSTRFTWHRIIEWAVENEVDAVILGCTELPILLKNETTKLPFLATTDLHIQMAVDFIID